MSCLKRHIRSSALFCGVVALIIFCAPVNFTFAARIADTDQPATTDTEANPVVQPSESEAKQKPEPQKEDKHPITDATKKVIKVSPAAPVLPAKQVSPASGTSQPSIQTSPPQGQALPQVNTQKKKDVSPAGGTPLSKQKDKITSPDMPGGKEKSSTPQQVLDPGKNKVPEPMEPASVDRALVKQVKKQSAEKYVTIDFDNVDIGVFIKFVSELTGKNFIIDDRVKGKATIISPKKIPLEDVYKVFLSVLEVNGFATVPVGDMIKIVPATSAREKSVETRFKKEVGDPDDRMVTHIMSLERANPDEIKRVLDPIVSKSSSVISYPPAGMLVITDFLSNIKRLQDIVKALDVEGAGDQISYVPLRNASASEVVKSLTSIYQQRRPNVTPVRLVSDARTNSIILLASVADMESLRRLIEMMDKDLPRDDSNIQVYRLQNSVAEDLAKVLNSIVKEGGSSAAQAQKSAVPVVSKNVQVVPDKATNTLVIMAEREDFKVLESIIKKLDVPRPMVYIEALIMEVNANKDFKLGVEWGGLKDTGHISGSPDSGSGAFIGSGGAGTTGNTGVYNALDSLVTTVGTDLVGLFPAGFLVGIIGAGIKIGDILFPTIGAVVQAYQADQEVSILSTPQIMTLNNEEAEINVGSNVPYVIRQDTTTAATVDYSQYEYRAVGVILNITPNINEGNFIRLKISQQVTKVTSTGTSTVSTPTTLKRTVKTSVVVKDKETIVIGGLIGDSTQDNTYKLPLLGDIPLLGWLFKTKSKGREKTNLYVFITPHIVRTQEDASALYQEKRGKMGE